MKIIVTVEELIDLSAWEEFCELKGLNPYALREGLIDSEEEFTLTIEEAKRLGFI